MTNLLIIEDETRMREVIMMLLSDMQLTMYEARDGAEAIEIFDSETIHMVITDLNMPNLDGINLIRQLRAQARYKFIPIVMLTTESQNEKKLEGKAAGATGWIVKPFKPEQLVAVVKKVLG